MLSPGFHTPSPLNNRPETTVTSKDKLTVKLFNLFFEIEFFIKVAVACTLVQQLIYWLSNKFHFDFTAEVLLYWLIGSVSFYSIGIFIEKVLKTNQTWRERFNVRVKKVREQPFPEFTAKGILVGEIKSLAAAAIILYLAPEVHRGNSWLLNFGWFFARIIVADFCFYVTHRLFHQKFLQDIHLKHHEFLDSSSFVAGHKSLLEYAIVTIADVLPVFVFGYDITQLCAWTAIGNAYNLEGHSSLSIFFIDSDFHDLHHSRFKGNYGIQGFWDRIFNTLNHPTKKPGIMFPAAALEKNFLKPSCKNIDNGN
ncbi:MAG: sterol desaturase family protein [Microcoleus sp. PH2017_10_PVI_O_A]|uniref:sterol desaturase family protein n=1 Tax=unclassified Microcoleus TaxID=2642155 RepID=UPI001DA400E4|nr:MULTISPECIES: sterol desaturase family protein [unclassified Microcoleus]MCC3409687.1 sterol desaturase family protein [Microcoleus sp. PH2017_10_PVI_O_A]MCC3463952.1 sterol desaturase family protein [Microcoleus sp. PH2017_11_PCY_U_A]MCC3482277.1 sterol desaturase family protein [Microcoleus sp. PH2017_12_PCY_D_A]MCC3563257.1 sterol desaturase family protein [Microcoleus sp. PH2017_27_LUM_O_A]